MRPPLTPGRFYSLEAAAKWTEKYRTLNKAPRTLGDIERWLRVRNSFHSMPSDSGSYRYVHARAEQQA